MKILILTPFKTASHTLLELLNIKLNFATLRTHGYLENQEFSPNQVTHIITLDREDSELWMLSRMFQDIDQLKYYPYAFSNNPQDVLNATPQEILNKFDSFDWLPYKNDPYYFETIQKEFGIVLEKGCYGIFTNENTGQKVYYMSVEKFDSELVQFAQFLGISHATLQENLIHKNTADEKWYSSKYLETKKLLLERRNKKEN